MKRLFIMLLTCLVCPMLLKGQAGPPSLSKVIPPSPEIASITRYGLYPVTMFNGLPGISIPIYNVNIRGFSLPISLDYHASGIKVDDLASWVGLGWNINAGGAITRTVMGVPDDDPATPMIWYQAF
ncbi:hypothetical protein [Chitinophaga sp. 212800010-3]|uniref:hypothetical protein n=1 Tax=unclassified Chitinophaga TaxID=2619133 RepID=UPI002DF2E4A7|nr:hypothetical protein [Chitinophaga sp. 212800010-3]